MIQCLQPRRLDLGHHSQQTPTWTKANRLSTYTHLPFVFFEFFCTNRLSKQGSHVLFSIDLPKINVTSLQDENVTEYAWCKYGFSAKVPVLTQSIKELAWQKRMPLLSCQEIFTTRHLLSLHPMQQRILLLILDQPRCSARNISSRSHHHYV